MNVYLLNEIFIFIIKSCFIKNKMIYWPLLNCTQGTNAPLFKHHWICFKNKNWSYVTVPLTVLVWLWNQFKITCIRSVLLKMVILFLCCKEKFLINSEQFYYFVLNICIKVKTDKSNNKIFCISLETPGLKITFFNTYFMFLIMGT